MTNSEIVEQTIAFVKETLQGAEGGHDWFHIQRVFNNTLLIAKEENVDILVVSLGALLHDIADAKFNNGDETVGPKLAHQFLTDLKVDHKTIDHVIQIIENISFKNSLEKNKEERFSSLELAVVQDADRLDAMGAIGIARAFNYGGFKNRELYNPEIAPNLKMSKEEYKKSKAPTLNHFYEKLLFLKDKMNTQTGKKLAEERHEYMLGFLKQFYQEWNPLEPHTGFTI
ncbi:HD domain-containing protein [Zobellia sp. B3R18]|uniref:HD domain-containing protein n=1 Tax=Zobellia sp. B3R18 TaxID=2841568 RepID=UPI001C0737DA|nr:HD domain-containing protein [Zobellia sp. B3R18]MBU2974769.1 HD domain-containing protein [Zobellia sp. B3R18]